MPLPALSIQPADASGALQSGFAAGQQYGQGLIQAKAGTLAASGDYQGAQSIALKSGDLKFAAQLGQLDQQQRDGLREKWQQVGGMATQALNAPDTEVPTAAAYIASHLTESLIEQGASPEQAKAEHDKAVSGLNFSDPRQARLFVQRVATNASSFEQNLQMADTQAKMSLTKAEMANTQEYRKAELAQGQQRIGLEAASLAADPMKSAYGSFLKENPGASAEEKAAFIQKSRAFPRSAPAMAMQKFMEENPDATAADVSTFAASMKAQGAATTAFATGKQGQAVNSFNVATNHLQTLSRLVDALQNNDIQAVNRIGNAFASETGNPAPNNFETAKQIVGNEIVKAIVGAGGGVGDRDKAQAVLDNANSPAQLKGAISTLTELMGGQLKGLKQQYEQTTKKTDFDARLSPAAQALFEKPNESPAEPTQGAWGVKRVK